MIPRTRFVLFLAIFLVCSGVRAQNASPIVISVPIGAILNQMPNGYLIPDGNRIYCEKIFTGTGNTIQTGFGAYNQPNLLGGPFDGCDPPVMGCSPPPQPPDTSILGNLLPSFVGNHSIGSFTRINTLGQSVDQGFANNFESSIGFHFWYDRPVGASQIIAIDLDGNVASNGEWCSVFAFNNGSLRLPDSIDILPSSNPNYGNRLIIDTLLNETWNTLLTTATNFPAIHDNFRTATTITGTNPNISTVAFNAGSLDPDHWGTQANFIFNPNTFIDHVFFLWGIVRNVPLATTQQSSGISCVNYMISPDFGDAPDSYQTLFASGGPSNGIWNYLHLGDTVTNELNAIPSVGADTDFGDDGIDTVADINTSVATGTETQSGLNYTANVTIYNNSGKDAKIVGWLDWNNDGAFDSTEAISVVVPSMTTEQTVPMVWSNQTIAAISTGQTYLRLRTSTDTGALTIAAIGGYLKDGEVEDYRIPIVNSVPTPLDLINFNAQWQQNDIAIRWETTIDNETKTFAVERSFNGRDFTKIGEVSTPSKISDHKQYNFVDGTIHSTNEDVVYYRLQLLASNGTNSYSKVTQLKIDANTANYTFYPNPASGTLHFGMLKNVVAISIADLSGKVLSSIPTTAIANNTIQIQDLKNGIYWLSFQLGNNKKITRKLVIQH